MLSDDNTKPIIYSYPLNLLLELELPERENLLAPWLPKGGLAMVYAKRGVGKTYFGLEVCMAAANGSKFLCFAAPKPIRVLYIDGEMPAALMQERLKTIKDRTKISDSFIEPLFITPDLQKYPMPDLNTLNGQTTIENHIQDVDLVILP